MYLNNYEASGGDIKYLELAESNGMAAFVQGHSLDVRLSGAMIAVSTGYILKSKVSLAPSPSQIRG